MSEIKQVSQHSDHTLIEYNDGTVEAGWHELDAVLHIKKIVFTPYKSKADYEIAKLDKATKERLGK